MGYAGVVTNLGVGIERQVGAVDGEVVFKKMLALLKRETGDGSL